MFNRINALLKGTDIEVRFDVSGDSLANQYDRLKNELSSRGILDCFDMESMEDRARPPEFIIINGVREVKPSKYCKLVEHYYKEAERGNDD